ncbi:hypothetical protein [Bacillus sp. EAC]|uniref:hypothetical protein n=1 Tax=Bacillus sp. EAC TaxID=1978338 RepID=UPI000B44B3B0|nr:hypothetical protein [Bacillus sp. EAC]
MKKKIVCIMCLALPMLASTVGSASATQSYDGKLTGYLETKNSFNTSNGWIHVKHEQYSALGKSIKITPLKKNILGVFTPVSDSVQPFSGDRTVTYQEGVSNGEYKLAFDVSKGANTSYLGVRGEFW